MKGTWELPISQTISKQKVFLRSPLFSHDTLYSSVVTHISEEEAEPHCRFELFGIPYSSWPMPALEESVSSFLHLRRLTSDTSKMDSNDAISSTPRKGGGIGRWLLSFEKR